MMPGGASAFWNNPTFRGWFWQIVTVVVIVTIGAVLVHNTIVNLQRQSIATGLSFLGRESGFEISESLIDYSATSTYARAFLVGVLNTVEVAVAGIILSTILGILLGIARLSPNWLLSRLALCYVELIRNIPLLLQLLLIYSILNTLAPAPRQAWKLLPDLYLTNRGLFLPIPMHHPSHVPMLAALLLGIAGAFVMQRWARKRQDRTGQGFPTLAATAGLVIGLPLLVWLGFGAPLALSVPVLTGFNFTGGTSVSPELTALLAGLVIYTTAYIGEIVRSGIQAVSHGQTEAASALGLKRGLMLRLVVLPQAVRIIVPPLTSQFLNLTKNSTLAVAIGFPDFVSVVNTQMNQTGQAIEGMAAIMGFYLAISLAISLAMNIYNARIALKSR
ncbi:MAG TPA: ABC transporter permease subunit [Aliidongia sp.]|nr:ABC transporter permease subunit [Aliidongia sp.]